MRPATSAMITNATQFRRNDSAMRSRPNNGLPGRTIGGSYANAAFCHAAPRQDACHVESLAIFTPSHCKILHNTGGPAEFVTVTRISFSPSRRRVLTSTLRVFFQSLPSRMRLDTLCPLIVTLPAVKQRIDIIAIEDERSILNDFLKIVEMGATRCGIESNGFGYKIQRESKFSARKGMPLSRWQSHQSHAPPSRIAIHRSAARLLGFMVSASCAIKLKQFVVPVRRFLLPSGSRQIARLLRRRYRFSIAASLGIGRRQGSDENRRLVFAKLAGALSQSHSFGSVAKSRIVIRCQEPGKIVQRLDEIRLRVKSFVIIVDCLLRLFASLINQSELVVSDCICRLQVCRLHEFLRGLLALILFRQH